ncbi:hypothetical protein ABK040_004656 [Willaertia magna]
MANSQPVEIGKTFLEGELEMLSNVKTLLQKLESQQIQLHGNLNTNTTEGMLATKLIEPLEDDFEFYFIDPEINLHLIGGGNNTNEDSGLGSSSNSSNGNATGTQSLSNGMFTSSRLTLEKIIGLTTDHNAKLSIHPQTHYVAYCAANVIACYNPRKNKQYQFLQNINANKTFSCVQFSVNGRYIAAGERGSKPSIIVWDAVSGKKLTELKKESHLYGVRCLAFSNDTKYLVSVGEENDGTFKLWDLNACINANNNSSISNNNKAICISGKNSRKPYDVAFSPDGNFFVIVGDKFIKYCHIEQVNGNLEVKSTRCILGNFKDSTFVSVDVLRTKEGIEFYAVTSQGILCVINENRQITKWLDLKVKTAYSVSVNEEFVCCGCSNGVIRLFEPNTLKFKCTLPRPPSIAQQFNQGSKENECQIHCMASRLFDNKQLVAIYSDRSFFIWDISNTQRIAKYRSFLSHSDSIWDIDLLPDSITNESLPFGTFATCSSDNTIRLWNVESSSSLHPVEKIERGESFISKNIFCKDLLSVHEYKISDENGEQGVRSIRFSSNGSYIACGDRQGVLSIIDPITLQQQFSVIAHDAEILSIDFSISPENQTDILIATCSRDRLIHVFQYDDANTKLVASLDDHTSSVTAIKFAIDSNNCRYLVSCSADKSVVFRKIEQDDNGYTFKRYQNTQASFGTIFDMDINSANEIVTVGQDKRINIWELDKCKAKQSIRVDTKTSTETFSPSAEPLRVSFDVSGNYIVVSSTDKYIRIYNLQNGECVARACGHSEIITGVKFSKDCRKVISVSGDGCIFIWKISPNLTKLMTKNKQDSPPLTSTTSTVLSTPQLPSSTIIKSPPCNIEVTTRETLLPSWAKTKGFTKSSNNINSKVEAKTSASKWNERVELDKTLKIAPVEELLIDSTEGMEDVKSEVIEEIAKEDQTVEVQNEDEVIYFNSETTPILDNVHKVSDEIQDNSKTPEDKLDTVSDEISDEEMIDVKSEKEIQKDDNFLSKNFENLSEPFKTVPLNNNQLSRFSVTTQFLKKAIGVTNQPKEEKRMIEDKLLSPIRTPSKHASINKLDSSLTVSTNINDLKLQYQLSVNQINHSFNQTLNIIEQMTQVASDPQDVDTVHKYKESLVRMLQHMTNSYSSRISPIHSISEQSEVSLLEKYSDRLLDLFQSKLTNSNKQEEKN